MEKSFTVNVKLDNRDERVIQNVCMTFSVVADDFEQAEAYACNYLTNVLQITPIELSVEEGH